MFFSPTSIQSSAIRDLSVNMDTNQVMVKYTDGDQYYLYEGVHFNHLVKLLFGKVESIGQWVNECVKGNQYSVLAW